MNEPQNEAGANPFGRVRKIPAHTDEPVTNEPLDSSQKKGESGANEFEYPTPPTEDFETVWLTVDEAVTYCDEQGLSRTAKTIRKWAERSYNIPEGDVVSRREDTLWGRYRWKIEKASLARKVIDELSRERVHTGANEGDAVPSEITVAALSNMSGPVQTSSNEKPKQITNFPGSNAVEPIEDVRTRSNELTVTDELATLRAENVELRKQQDRDRSEIEFLREEVIFNRSLKGDFANNSSWLLETLETLAIGGRLERGGGKREEPVRYRQAEVERGEV